MRTAIAVVIAAYILLALRTPSIAPGLYLIFLVSYDVPYLTFSRSVFDLTFQCLGVGAVLLILAATGNDPMVRFLAIPVFTFFSAYFLRASTRPLAFMNIGIFSIITLGLWEGHLPADRLVRLSMWPIATGALAVGCKVVIEYVFTRRDPHFALQREMEARVESIERLFQSYIEHAPAERRNELILTVSRYAIAGQSRMRSLLEEVQSHPNGESKPFTISPSAIPSIARLMDLAAAYGHSHEQASDPDDLLQLTRIVAGLSKLRAGDIEGAEAALVESAAGGLLPKIEAEILNVCEIANSDHFSPAETPRPAQKSWLRSDAWTNPEYAAYATKMSLSAAICYLAYNALAWPGISTATITVLVAGLSTTGASNQKLLFRIVGAVIGGLVFGIGCIVFVYPYSDTALPFLITVGLVSFLAAWMARSAHLSYVGLQIAFSFLLIAFEGFSAPTQMSPARDRIIGVMLALVVMWVVFHQVNPTRAIDKMREGLAQLLEIQAGMFARTDKTIGSNVVALRREAANSLANIRSLGELVPYELGEDVDQDLRRRDAIQDAVSSSMSIFFLGFSDVFHRGGHSHPVALAEAEHEQLSQTLRGMASRLRCNGSTAAEGSSPEIAQSEPPSPTNGASDLWRFCSRLEAQCRLITDGC